MSDFENYRKKTEKKEEKEKIYREKFGGYFLNLSQLTFATMVLGALMPFFTNGSNVELNPIGLLLGCFATVAFAYIRRVILK